MKGHIQPISSCLFRIGIAQHRKVLADFRAMQGDLRRATRAYRMELLAAQQEYPMHPLPITASVIGDKTGEADFEGEGPCVVEQWRYERIDPGNPLSHICLNLIASPFVAHDWNLRGPWIYAPSPAVAMGFIMWLGQLIKDVEMEAREDEERRGLPSGCLPRYFNFQRMTGGVLVEEALPQPAFQFPGQDGVAIAAADEESFVAYVNHTADLVREQMRLDAMFNVTLLPQQQSQTEGAIS